MKILICPDKFKDSLTASEAAGFIRSGILKVDPDAECILLPMADGGEGTVDTMVSATGGSLIKVLVHNPLMRLVDSVFGIAGDGKTAIIEMAAASGLALLKPDERNPMKTTTYGTGELVSFALDKGCSQIIIGIGGSATVDGGVGMAQALGIKFTDEHGQEIGKGGACLGAIRNINLSNLNQKIKKCRIIAASDVTNFLTGTEGAAYVFAPQKGANPEEVKSLDDNLNHLSDIIKESMNLDLRTLKGGGAAGGMGAGIVAFLGGEIRNGFEVIAEAVNLEARIRESEIVLTGEGKIDRQTAFGKTPAGVAKLASKCGKPVIVFGGTIDEGANELYRLGVDAMVPITDKPLTLDESVRRAGELLESAAERVFRLMMIAKKTQG